MLCIGVLILIKFINQKLSVWDVISAQVGLWVNVKVCYG